MLPESSVLYEKTTSISTLPKLPGFIEKFYKFMKRKTAVDSGTTTLEQLGYVLAPLLMRAYL